MITKLVGACLVTRGTLHNIIHDMLDADEDWFAPPLPGDLKLSSKAK